LTAPLAGDMDYELAVGGGPDTIPGGTSVLLVHPSTAETDRIDTDFLQTDTDRFLVISTRTTAREVTQKLDYYDVNEDNAVILDTLSVDRGYSRRTRENVHYVSAPDDLDGIVMKTEEFLETYDGKLRLSIDSITELAYYAGEEDARGAVDRLLALLEEHDAVGLFHLSAEVHDDDVVQAYRDQFDVVIDLDAEDNISVES
jgi:KaiC/GvpD/RAD55 family RecA-like ATPase